MHHIYRLLSIFMKIELSNYHEIIIKMKHPIICIPRICKSITQQDIKKVFDTYNFGIIRNINIVQGNENNKVFIKFNYWNRNLQSQQFRDAINNKQEIKIFHSFPNFWKCYKSFSKL